MTRKSPALFMAFILISASFSLSLLAEPAIAANACCQKTKSGDYCQFTSQEECDPGFQSAPALCENTNFCQLGCCNDDSEGICFTNSPRSLCDAKGGTFSSDPSCSIPQCEKGACIIGNECSFATLSRCKAAAASFENTGFKFDPSIKNELDAINLCRSEEKGCCASQDTCSYTTRDSCEAASSNSTGFFNGKFCSDSSLTCNCAPRSYKGCLPNEDDVFWFDSCGNPEAKAEECDYASGTICSQVESGSYKCISTSCLDTYQNSASPDSGGTKRSGESWCVYDASVGFGSDVVGSRHYRATCINGEEIVEPCKDYRQEFCISADANIQNDPSLALNPGSGKFTEAVCRTNRWQDCSSIDDQDDCEDQELRDCFWFTGSGRTNARGLFSRSSAEAGRCVPHVPPGSKFWEGEGSDICSVANQECTVVFRRPGIGILEGGIRQWECIANCECLQDDWVVGANNYCKALGDCGAYFNIVGDASTDGLSSNQRKIKASEVGDWSQIASGSSQAPDKQGNWQQIWDKIKTGATLSLGISVFYRIASDIKFKDFFFTGKEGLKAIFKKDLNMKQAASTTFKTFTPKVGTPLSNARLPQGSKFVVKDVSSGDALANFGGNDVQLLSQQGNDAVFEVVNPDGITGNADMLAGEGTTVQGSSGFATFTQWLNTIMWIYTIYQILDVLLADTKEEHYTATCEPWQAPAGGNKCELCNTRGLFNGENIKPCTEYACKSLGVGCSLLNEGTGNETCTYVSPRDTNSPILSPLTNLLAKGYTVSSISNGYRINEEIKPFEEITFGVKTNEPSQCKITNKLGTKFPDIQAFLGGSLYQYDHIASVKIPQEVFNEEAVQITNGGKYSFYVRCQDGNGNDNDADYIIQFNVKPGPDLTPPSIDLTSIPNAGFVRNNAKQANITFYLNEPSQCRWSSIDSGYEIMPNRMQCILSSFNPEPNNLYACNTKLTDIKDDAINKYFVRCQDLSNNTMQQSFQYSLIGTVPLRIIEKGPSGRTPNPVLKIRTADGATKDGKAICGYGRQDNLASMIQFLNTGSDSHSQQLALEDGTHTIYIRCLDEAGNEAADSVTFTSFTDKLPPLITRIFEDRSLSRSVLHISTDENSICEFSNRGQFAFGKGTRMPVDLTLDHEAPWGSLAYYIICADASNNTGQVTAVFP